MGRAGEADPIGSEAAEADVVGVVRGTGSPGVGGAGRGAARGAAAAVMVGAACWSLGCSVAPEAAPAPAEPEVAYAEIGDIRMYYEVHGAGEPVILLHGGSTSAAVWSRQIPVLAEKYRVIVPDLRAHGRTNDGAGPLTYAGMTEDVVALLDRLGVERAHVIGWSMGGTIGLHLALTHPDRVGKLVLLGAPYHRDGLDDGFREWFRGAAPSDWAQEAIDFYRANAPDPDHWDVFFGKLRDLVMTEPTFTEADLARVRAPTLVVYGREETVIQPAHIEAMARAIPGAELVPIDGTGHHAYMERPEEFNAAIVEFLRR